jgi:hypothetical protein
MKFVLHTVIPAQAAIQCWLDRRELFAPPQLDTGLRRCDGFLSALRFLRNRSEAMAI